MQKRKTSLTTISLILLILIAIITLVIFFVVKNNNESSFYFKEPYSFSETRDTTFDLTDLEKNNINKYLENSKYENDQLYGFTSFNPIIDLYNANYMINLINVYENQNLKNELGSKLKFIESIDYENLSFIDLLYYINILKKLGKEFVRDDIFTSLKKYYNSAEKLFFAFGDNDLKNIKIVATSMCLDIFPEILESGIFDVESGLQTAFNEYTFLLPSDQNTFYNSGGDIIFACNQVNLIRDTDKNTLNSWFNDWKIVYDQNEIDTIFTAVQYSNFLDIAKIFDSNYSSIKLQNFYNTLTKDDIILSDDYQIFLSVLKNINANENTVFKSALLSKLQDSVSVSDFATNEIDIIATTYGVLLAKNTGFEVDKVKLQNLIRSSYSALDNINSTAIAVDILYYTIILDQQMNNFSNSFDQNKIQSLVNGMLDSLNYGDYIVDDLITARKIIEIIADSTMHNKKLSINNAQRKKISNAIKKYIKANDVKATSLITDLFYLSDLLELKLIHSDDLINANSTLIKEKGNVMYLNKDIPSDILTTKEFLSCLTVLDKNESLKDKQEFANSLVKEDGVFLPYKNAEDYEINLKTILFGNVITKKILGGSK